MSDFDLMPLVAEGTTGFEVDDLGVDETPDVAVKTRGITKFYGQLAAVDGIDLDIPRGAVFGLIGPNGAGKSTLMSMMASLLLPSTGVVRVLGHDPISEAAAVRARVGYMPDGLGVYDAMTVEDYLGFYAGAYRIARSEHSDLIDGLLELVELTVKRTAEVNSLSRGMKQRLSLARSLVHDPELLILDEPASGLDPRARVELRELIVQLKEMGKTVIVSSHILSELQEICTHVGIVEAGKLLVHGSPRDILDRLGGQRRVEVRFVDGTSQHYSVADDIDQAALLRRLIVEEEAEIVEFIEAGSGLEDVFMSVTEGIVQ